MKLKELKSRIVYFTMLISMILIFLGLINNNGSNVNPEVLLFTLFIFSLLNNIFIYQIFKKSEKKVYIKKIAIFYAIVFVVSALDILLKEIISDGLSIKTYGTYFVQKIYLDFQFIIILFLENILTIIHINAYKASSGGAKKFAKYLFMYVLKHYLLSVIPFFILFFVYKIVVESDGMHYVYFHDDVYLLFAFFILTVITTVNYLLTCFNEFVLLKRHIKFNNIGVLIAIFIGVPIFQYNSALLKPFIDIREGYQIIKLMIDKNNEKRQRDVEIKKQREITKERMYEYIEQVIKNYTLATDLTNAKVGDVVEFGKSYMKANKNNKINSYYYVFDKDGDMLTLISFYLIDILAYEDVASAETIEGYMNYLNTDFYNYSFSDEEKSYIVEKIYEDGKKHKVYLPSARDLSRYDVDENIGKVLWLTCPDKNLYDSYFCKRHAFNIDDSYLKYLLSPHILKPNTIRYFLRRTSKDDYMRYKIREYGLPVSEDDYGDAFEDVEDNSSFVYRHLYVRPKITIDVSRIKK